MISSQGLIYIHNVQFNKIPQAIYELYQVPNCPIRKNTKIIPKYIPKTKILKNSLFYHFSEIYSNLPDHLKILIASKFKKEIKDYVKYNFQPYSFPKNGHQSDSESD